MAAKFFVLAAVALLAATTGDANAADAVRNDCRSSRPVTLSGVVRSQGTVQEEPQATPQTYFFLDLAAAYCGQTSVLVGMPDQPSCPDGTRATLEGTYLPADSTFNTAMLLDARLLECRP
jgi:hypothetical protein